MSELENKIPDSQERNKSQSQMDSSSFELGLREIEPSSPESNKREISCHSTDSAYNTSAHDEPCSSNISTNGSEIDINEEYPSDGSCCSSPIDSSVLHIQPSILKNRKPSGRFFNQYGRATRRVQFNNVETYFFDRAQGFICVPTQGGSTLGMSAKHWAIKSCKLDDHEIQRHNERRTILLEDIIDGKLVLPPDQIKMLERIFQSSIAKSPSVSQRITDSGTCGSAANSSATSNSTVGQNNVVTETRTDFVIPNDERGSVHHESVNDDLLPTKIPLTNVSNVALDCHSHAEFEPPDNDSHALLRNLEDNYFLQPFTIKKRRIVLKQAGVLRIDHAERSECQAIRASRETCGCTCPDGVCLPEYCLCAQNGISCQVDRVSFPCACLAPTLCHNPGGRIEFNPTRVRTHYLHTLMRLEMEREPEDTAGIPDVIPPIVAGPMSEADDTDGEPSPKLRRVQLPDDTKGAAEACGEHVSMTGGALGLSMSESSALADESGVQTACVVPSVGETQDSDTAETEVAALAAPSTAGEEQDGEEFLAAYNSTLQGGCRDCQNDRYVRVLMRELDHQQQQQQQQQHCQQQLMAYSGLEVDAAPPDLNMALLPSNHPGYAVANGDAVVSGACGRMADTAQAVGSASVYSRQVHAAAFSVQQSVSKPVLPSESDGLGTVGLMAAAVAASGVNETMSGLADEPGTSTTASGVPCFPVANCYRYLSQQATDGIIGQQQMFNLMLQDMATRGLLTAGHAGPEDAFTVEADEEDEEEDVDDTGGVVPDLQSDRAVEPVPAAALMDGVCVSATTGVALADEAGGPPMPAPSAASTPRRLDPIASFLVAPLLTPTGQPVSARLFADAETTALCVAGAVDPPVVHSTVASLLHEAATPGLAHDNDPAADGGGDGNSSLLDDAAGASAVRRTASPLLETVSA